MPPQRFFGDHLDADPVQAGNRPREVLLHERTVEADGFEDLRAAVALKGGNAHLGHHLEDALIERLDVVRHRLLVREAHELPLLDHVVQRLEREVRVDDAGAVPEQQRAVMDLAGVARLHDERAAGARPLTHQMMVDARRGQQARNRGAVPIDAAVRKDQNRVAGVDRVVRPPLEILDGSLQPRAAVARVEQHRQRDRPEARLVDVPQLRQLVVVDDRVLDLDLAARLRPRVEQVALGPDRRFHRGHQLLTNRVERRVGHLGEQLREVVIQQPRTIRQHGQRRVGAHRTDRLVTGGRHRRQDDPQVLVRVAEGLLPAQHGLVAERRRIRRRREVLDVDQVPGQPLAVRVRPGEIALDLLVGHDPALHGVDEEDAPGMQALLDQDVLGRDIQHADLGRHDHQVVLRHVVPGGTQTVAVEHGADEGPVGEGDRRRAIPRLHQRRVVLVEGLELGAHAFVAGPRLGDHHQDGMRERAPGHHEELENIVECRRVAAAFPDDRQDLLQVLAQHVRSEEPLAGAHPVDVAAQRVDFAVVRDVAVRVGQRPGRERVGAESLMHERERRLDIGIAQVRKHRLDLGGRQHALVDERVRRQAGDVERPPFGDLQPVDRVFHPLSDDKQLPLETGRSVGTVLGTLRPGPDEQLLEHRFGGDGRGAQETVVGRHLPPPEHRLPFLPHDPLNQAANLLAGSLLARQEDKPRAVLPGRRQREAERQRRLPQKPIRHLDEDARSVPRVVLGAERATVQQVDEHPQPLFDDRVRTLAFDVRDEPDATGVVLVARIVQACGSGWTLDRRQVEIGHCVPGNRIGDTLFMSDLKPEVKYNDYIIGISNLDWIPALLERTPSDGIRPASATLATTPSEAPCSPSSMTASVGRPGGGSGPTRDAVSTSALVAPCRPGASPALCAAPDFHRGLPADVPKSQRINSLHGTGSNRP